LTQGELYVAFLHSDSSEDIHFDVTYGEHEVRLSLSEGNLLTAFWEYIAMKVFCEI
jgi:hypothetical protein